MSSRQLGSRMHLHRGYVEFEDGHQVLIVRYNAIVAMQWNSEYLCLCCIGERKRFMLDRGSRLTDESLANLRDVWLGAIGIK